MAGVLYNKLIVVLAEYKYAFAHRTLILLVADGWERVEGSTGRAGVEEEAGKRDTVKAENEG